MKNCILGKSSSSLHNSAFLLVVEQVGLLGTGTWANNYWFLLALLLMVCCCVRCCWGGAANMFHLDSLGCFLVLINSIIPLGAQSILQKTSFRNRKLDQESPPVLGRMDAWPAVILGSRNTKQYSFKSTCSLPSSSDIAVEKRNFSEFMAICQEWMSR